DELVRNRNAFDNFNALPGQRLVFHVAHRDETIDAGDSEPVDHIGHELLEPRILHAGHAFRPLEISSSCVTPLLALARVVDEKFGHLAEGAPFLAVVDYDAESTRLGTACAFFDAVDEVRSAGADIRAEHVGAVAFVMHAAGNVRPGTAEILHITHQINRGAANGRQKDLQVEPGHQLGIHACGLLKQRPAQAHLVRSETLCNPGQIPDRVDGDFDYRDVAVLVHDVPVAAQSAGGKRSPDLVQIEPGPGDCDCRPHVQSFADLLAEAFPHQ